MITMDYISGFIDADGHVTRNDFQASLMISNTKKDILEEIQEAFEKYDIPSHITKKDYKHPGWKMCYNLVVTHRKNMFLLNNLLSLKIDYKRERLQYWANLYADLEIKKAIVKSYNGKFKINELADLLKVNRKTVYNWRNKNGVCGRK